MNEANVRAEIFNLLERLYLWPITQTDARTPLSKEVFGLLYALEKAAPDQRSLIGALRGALSRVTTPPIGRPDILVLNPVGQSMVVECKVFDKPRDGVWARSGFDTKSITPEQRNWMKMWQADNGLAYLALGTVHGRPNSPKEPRYLWLIPWEGYVKLEAQVLACDVATIPLVETAGMRTCLREQGLWATRMFAPFALKWDNGAWHLNYDADEPYHVAATLGDIVVWQGERDLSAWKAAWKAAWKGEPDAN